MNADPVRLANGRQRLDGHNQLPKITNGLEVDIECATSASTAWGLVVVTAQCDEVLVCTRLLPEHQ